jgi:hypothetical protein
MLIGVVIATAMLWRDRADPREVIAVLTNKVAMAIVDVRAGVDDGALAVDDVGRGDRECPFIRRTVIRWEYPDRIPGRRPAAGAQHQLTCSGLT